MHFFIAEEKVQECPKITVTIGEEEVSAILDTGRELTIMNEHLYEKIKQRGNSYLELPAQHLKLVSAFNNKGKRVKKQIFVPVMLGNVSIDQVFIISSQLLTSAILGVDFFINTCAIINFPERCALFNVDHEIKQVFNATKETSAVISGNYAPGYTQGDVLRVSTSSYKVAKPLTIGDVTGQQHHGDISGTKLIWDQNGSRGWHERQARCPEGIIRCNEYDKSLRGMEARDGMAAADHSQRNERQARTCVPPTVKKDADTIVPATPTTAVNCFGTTTSDKYLTINSGNHTANDRVITVSKLRAKVDEETKRTGRVR